MLLGLSGLRLRLAPRVRARADGPAFRHRDGGYHAVPDRRSGRLRRLPRAARRELLIALAGPAVNFAIVGMVLILGLLGLDQVLVADGLESFVAYRSSW